VAEPLIEFDGVWKKFRRGEHHDSLRDLIPAVVKRLSGRGAKAASASAIDEDEFWVLREVSFAVRPGHALGIIGANGSGKSTSLKLLTRILKPNRGRAVVRGRAGALIELAAGFHPDLTGRENVFLQGAIMGMKRLDIRRRFDEIIEFAGIPDFIDTPVKRYSSGMNARLGFAIAAHLDPEVLLIDEVLAVGDYSFQQKCYARLEKFRKDGVPIAFVSHNMQAIAALCDQVLLLASGRTPVLGDVPTVLAEYVSTKGLTADPRTVVLSTRITDATTDAEIRGPVPPGAPLRLDASLTAKAEFVRCGVALQIVRSDGLVMFTGMSTIDGCPEVTLRAGDRLDLAIAFSANFLRGSYVVNINLVDTMRQWPPAIINGLGAFVVTETTRVAGCADVFPSYGLAVTPSAAAMVGR
jgi:lipopolysaccharide transport system ATP-binding protein